MHNFEIVREMTMVFSIHMNLARDTCPSVHKDAYKDIYKNFDSSKCKYVQNM